MTAEASSDSAINQPVPASPVPGERPAGASGEGPLARFARGERAAEVSKQDSPAIEENREADTSHSPNSEVVQQLHEATKPMAPGGQTPAGYRPQGRGDRPRSRRDKEREEDRQLDKELAAERGGGERGFRA